MRNRACARVKSPFARFAPAPPCKRPRTRTTRVRAASTLASTSELARALDFPPGLALGSGRWRSGALALVAGARHSNAPIEQCVVLRCPVCAHIFPPDECDSIIKSVGGGDDRVCGPRVCVSRRPVSRRSCVCFLLLFWLIFFALRLRLCRVSVLCGFCWLAGHQEQHTNAHAKQIQRGDNIKTPQYNPNTTTRSINPIANANRQHTNQNI